MISQFLLKYKIGRMCEEVFRRGGIRKHWRAAIEGSNGWVSRWTSLHEMQSHLKLLFKVWNFGICVYLCLANIFFHLFIPKFQNVMFLFLNFEFHFYFMFKFEKYVILVRLNFKFSFYLVHRFQEIFLLLQSF